MTQLLQFARVEANKSANNQVGTVLLDTLYLVKVPHIEDTIKTLLLNGLPHGKYKLHRCEIGTPTHRSQGLVSIVNYSPL